MPHRLPEQADGVVRFTAIDGGFEVWGRVRARPMFRFDRTPPVGMDAFHAAWWRQHGADCAHPREWVAVARCLVPAVGGDGSVWIAVDQHGTKLEWDECRLCGARFAPRIRPVLGYRPLRARHDRAAGLLVETAVGA